MRISRQGLASLIDFLLMLIIGLCIVLAYSDYTDSGICLTPSDSGIAGCSIVQSSIYGTLFGVKLSYFGLTAFLALGAVRLFSRKNWKFDKDFANLYIFAAGFGAAMAVYFIFLQVYVIKSICSNCVIIDGVAIAVFVFSFFEYKFFLRR